MVHIIITTQYQIAKKKASALNLVSDLQRGVSSDESCGTATAHGFCKFNIT